MATRIKTDILHARLRPGVKQKAQELAKAENRSLTNWLETMIERLYEEANPTNGADAASGRRRPATR